MSVWIAIACSVSWRRAIDCEAPRVASRPTRRMPTPTPITSSGIVISTPIGDASARATRIAGPSAAESLLLVTSFVDRTRRELERRQEPALATGGVEPDAG